jgi:hypothetical protein
VFLDVTRKGRRLIHGGTVRQLLVILARMVHASHVNDFISDVANLLMQQTSAVPAATFVCQGQQGGRSR